MVKSSKSVQKRAEVFLAAPITPIARSPSGTSRYRNLVLSAVLPFLLKSTQGMKEATRPAPIRIVDTGIVTAALFEGGMVLRKEFAQR